MNGVQNVNQILKPMVLVLLILIALPFVGGIILGIANIVSGGKILGQNQSGGYYSDADDDCTMNFFDDSRGASRNNSRSYSDPFDNHWESSFDWQDENNDGYDDRDDGFWNEREF